VRTQQIPALENRVPTWPIRWRVVLRRVPDDARLEEEAESLIRQVLDRGGMVQSIEDGFIQRQIADASAAYQQSVESGSEYIVGVNIHAEPEAPLPFDPFVLDPGLVERQIRRTQGIRKARPPAEHAAALKEVEQAARQGKNVMPSVVRAIKAHATVGEMCDVLRGVFGEYRAPIVY
jgi:methylmalonyl-CoA mutase N-terminal domain/subunit